MHFFWNIFVTLFCIFAIWKGCGVVGLWLSCRFITAVSFVNQNIGVSVLVYRHSICSWSWNPIDLLATIHFPHSSQKKNVKLSECCLLILLGDESHFTKIKLCFSTKMMKQVEDTSLKLEDLTTYGSTMARWAEL